MRRKAFFAALLGAITSARGQEPAVKFQRVSNPPRCPVCHAPVDFTPIKLMVLNDSGVFSANTLVFPVLVCPKDGVLFCVQP